MNDTNDTLNQEIDALRSKVDQANMPPELRAKISSMVQRLSRSIQYGSYSEEYERVNHYVDWVLKVPWETMTEDNLDLDHARQVLDTHHYGLEDIKERVLEYLAVLKLNRDQGKTDHIARAPILLLVGLVGTGKTTFAKSLAEAMNRQFIRIPFGGMGSAKDLRGQSRLHLEAEPGYVIKSLSRIQTRNPVILLDEIDRVAENARADIMGVLVELLDPEQNQFFIDHYLDFPVDLSQVLFIGTANNTTHIATAVLDRMEPITMPSYTDEQKIIIAKQYLLPTALKESGLPPQTLSIDESTWSQIVRPLGYDAGIRTLQRTVKGMVRKAAMQYVQGQITNVHISAENIKDYMPSYKNELI